MRLTHYVSKNRSQIDYLLFKGQREVEGEIIEEIRRTTVPVVVVYHLRYSLEVLFIIVVSSSTNRAVAYI
jgi:hypothetical protein